MRLGLLADVHESVENLRAALDRLARERVDRHMLLGDLFETGPRVEATVDLLIRAGVPSGVWGNHDFGLRSFAPGEPKFPFSRTTAGYFRGMTARVEIDDFLFQHIPPSHDPTTLEGIWSCFDEEFFKEPEYLAKVFARGTWTACFCGHFHRWSHATEGGFSDWRGERPLRLDRATRHLVSIRAVVERACAVLDTDERLLIPLAF